MPHTPWPQRCHPILVELVDSTCEEFAIPGVRLARPYFGFRSDQEQLALYVQGRAPLYEVNMQRIRANLTPITGAENERTVTNAKPGQSNHNLDPAEAADLVVVSLAKGVQYVWDEGADLDEDGVAEYVELGRIGERLGLIWGGAWKRKDWGHLELPPFGSVARQALVERLQPDPAKKGMGGAKEGLNVSFYDMREGVQEARKKYAYIAP